MEYNADNDLFECEVRNKNGDFAHELLMNGYAKLNIDKLALLDPKVIKVFKEK